MPGHVPLARGWSRFNLALPRGNCSGTIMTFKVNLQASTDWGGEGGDAVPPRLDGRLFGEAGIKANAWRPFRMCWARGNAETPNTEEASFVYDAGNLE